MPHPRRTSLFPRAFCAASIRVLGVDDAGRKPTTGHDLCWSWSGSTIVLRLRVGPAATTTPQQVMNTIWVWGGPHRHGNKDSESTTMVNPLLERSSSASLRQTCDRTKVGMDTDEMPQMPLSLAAASRMVGFRGRQMQRGRRGVENYSRGAGTNFASSG